MKSSRFLRATATAALAICVQVTGTAARAAEPFAVGVSRSPLSLPFFVAEDQGLLRQAGVDVRLVECIGGHRCMGLMLAGEVDAATVSDMVITTRALQGERFSVLATFVTSGRDSQVVANRAAGIARPADLRGKRVGYTAGSSSHYFLDTFLLVNGVAPDSIDAIDVAPEDMAAALADDRVAAVSTWQPWVQRTLDRVATSYAMGGEGVYTLTFNLVASDTTIAGRSEQLGSLLQALHRAEASIADNPAAARSVLAQRLKLDPAEVDRMWPNFDYRLTLAQSLLVTLESEANWARRRGVVAGEGIPNFLDYLAPAHLRQVAPEAVTLIE